MPAKSLEPGADLSHQRQDAIEADTVRVWLGIADGDSFAIRQWAPFSRY
jgi:hypothetical protein